MTACPKTLQVENVGKVTSPVTQVDVVAVNNASIYGTDLPLEELIGNTKSKLPSSIVIRKLIKMICVVDNANFFFRNINTPICKEIKDQHPLQSAGPSLFFLFIIALLPSFVKHLSRT